MISMSIVMRSGQIVEAIAKDEAEYDNIANALMVGHGVTFIKQEGFYTTYINIEEVVAVSASAYIEDEEEASDDAEASDEPEDEEEEDEKPFLMLEGMNI